jgi:glutamate synthase domain-containing protein 1
MLGQRIVLMLDALSCRGPDSAGVALYAPPDKGWLRLEVKLGDQGDYREIAEKVETVLAQAGAAVNGKRDGAYWSGSVPDATEVSSLQHGIESIRRDVEVVSAGKSLRLVKQTGSPAALDRTFSLSGIGGSHALGHTRLSTESKVDLSHSQPFWSHGYPDLAIAHNGHITNYHQLRRRYQQRGIRFYTENDSEVIAIYLAQRLEAGSTLGEALERMLTDLDGSFSCVAATSAEFGFVKDPFAFKPLLYAETSDFAAVATEEVALRKAIPGDYRVKEADVREVRIWKQ